jgi:hypothetical protein
MATILQNTSQSGPAAILLERNRAF